MYSSDEFIDFFLSVRYVKAGLEIQPHILYVGQAIGAYKQRFNISEGPVDHENLKSVENVFTTAWMT